MVQNLPRVLFSFKRTVQSGAESFNSKTLSLYINGGQIFHEIYLQVYQVYKGRLEPTAVRDSRVTSDKQAHLKALVSIGLCTGSVFMDV